MDEEMLTWDDVVSETEKVRGFFERLPEEMRSSAADYIIYEIVCWGSYNHFEALGIFTEAMLRYRETSLRVMAEEEEESNNE